MYSENVPHPSLPYALLRGASRFTHETICPECNRKLNSSWIRPDFRVSSRRRDIACTYDGYTLVSERFRTAWQNWGYPGARFLALPKDPQFFALQSEQVVSFDSESAGTRFEEYCNACQSYRVVVGTCPARLKGISTPLSPGLYRTDIEFASGIEQNHLLIVDPETRMQIKSAKFVGFEFAAVEAWSPIP
jgi:hypothetical protein